MFLENAKLNIAHTSEKIPADSICWDYDDAYNPVTDKTLDPHDFDWHFFDFDLNNVGDANFKEILVNFIENEMDFDNLTDQDPDSWEGIWRTLQQGGDIHSPVHIALAYQPLYEEERIYISDGWHRLGLYIKAGRKTIPAIIGVPKQK